jgi:hypothetical protein
VHLVALRPRAGATRVPVRYAAHVTRAPFRVAPACLLLAALVVAACGGSAAPSSAPPGSPTAGTPVPTPVDSPAGPTDPSAPTAAPATPGASTPAAESPGSTASADPGSTGDPEATPEPGAAGACSGNDQNREFFAQTARAVSWQVYCAVLPAGWFVETGAYRLANGGKLEITYAGPNGARLTLSQGAFCPDASGCVPSGSDAGDAAFGDRAGTLIEADGGRWAIVVDRGAPLSWLLATTGLDEARTRAFGEALAAVDGPSG